MSTWRCARFPDGEVPVRTAAGIVVFVDGIAVVDDPEIAAALRGVPAAFAISEQGADEWEPLKARPARAAPKAAWVAWAVHNGMAEDDAEALTVKALIAQFGG